MSRLFEIYWDILALLRLFEELKVQKSWQIKNSWLQKMVKSTNSRSRPRQTVKTYQIISGLGRFFDLFLDFWHWKVLCLTVLLLRVNRPGFQPTSKIRCNTGGLDLSRRGLNRDSRSRRRKKVSLDDWDISIEIKKSPFCSRYHLPVPKVLTETEKSVETWHIWQISTVCLDRDRELVNFITFLDRDFSICQDFWS